MKIFEEFANKVLAHKKVEYDDTGMRLRNAETGFQMNPYELSDVARACKEYADRHGGKDGISIVLKYSSSSALWHTRIWRGSRECQFGVNKSPAFAMIYGIINFIAVDEKFQAEKFSKAIA